jgi:glycosidase
MKVYMDIITNHTADVIKYQECHGPDAPKRLRETYSCPYRSIGDFPYTTIGDADGVPINRGFLGTDARHHTAANFKRLKEYNYAYTPFVPDPEKSVKNPAWLNDIRYYHNRGDTTWEGENSLTGDFSGLDDLMTSNPAVIDGFIDIYKQWITDFRVDGFRIDTAKHVNPEFWQEFAPAILEHARAEGIDHFHIFGEVYEFAPAQLAKFTTRDRFPAILDFAFQGVARAVIAEGKPARDLERLFDADAVYKDGFATAKRLPTFLGNHDMGRFSMFVRDANPEISEKELMQRIILGHALMMFSRGAPTIYYGDEQGFVSDGGDRGARETMFPGRTPDYLDNDLIGTDQTIGDDNFNTGHPVYEAIARMADIRKAEPALRRGAQMVRHSDLEGGVLVMSRFAPQGESEIVVAFNAGLEERRIAFPVDGRAKFWKNLAGDCTESNKAPGSYELTIPPVSFVACKAEF